LDLDKTLNKSEEVAEKRQKQRTLLNKFLDTPVEFIIKHNISPNVLSYLGLSCTIGAAIFLALGCIYWFIIFTWPAAFLIFWAGAFDIFDGEVARRTKKEGAAGAFLDSNLDRVSDAILILGLTYGGFINYFFGYVLLFSTIMISYIRSRAETEGIDMRGIGIMERAERLIILLVAIVLETWIYFISELITGTPWVIHVPFITAIPVTWFFLFFIITYISLIITTVVQRLVFAFKKLSISDSKLVENN
jgi:archaetidylinositol phosphate synthase